MQKDETTLVDYRNRLIVNPGQKLRLKDVDPAFKGPHETQESAAPELERYRQKLGQLQALLYAEKQHSILIVLQALDSGTITAIYPAAASATNYKLTFKLDHPIGVGHRSVGRFFENFEELEAREDGTSELEFDTREALNLLFGESFG